MSADPVAGGCSLGPEVVLHEYEIAKEEVPIPTVSRWLKAEKLAVAMTSDGLRIKAQQHVGILPFQCGVEACSQRGRHVIVVLPKGASDRARAPLFNFIELMHLAGGGQTPLALADGWTATTNDGVRSRFLLLLAAGFAAALREMCQRDLRRAYDPLEDQLAGRVRGRLHARAHGLNVLRGRAHRMPCSWEEFTFDHSDHRVLESAMRALERSASNLGASSPIRAIFAPIHAALGHVDESTEPLSDLARSRLAKVSTFYRRSLLWAGWILQGIGGVRGGSHAAAITLDANEIFEIFCERVLERSITESLRSESLRFKAQADAPSPLPNGATRHPDLVVRRGATVIAVGDAKYKQAFKEVQANTDEDGDEKVAGVSIGSRDVDQLFVYQRVLNVANGFFMVPFWSKSDSPVRMNAPMDYAMSPLDGGAKASVRVVGLNLARRPSEILSEAAAEIARWWTPS